MSAEIESVACLEPGQQSDVSAVGMAPADTAERGRERWHRTQQAMKRDWNGKP